MGLRKQIGMTRCNFQESTAPASKYLHKLEILCDVIRAIFHAVTSTPTARSACVSVCLCPVPVTVTSVLCPSLVHAFGKCRVSVCPSVRLPICPCVSPSFCHSYAGDCSSSISNQIGPACQACLAHVTLCTVPHLATSTASDLRRGG